MLLERGSGDPAKRTFAGLVLVLTTRRPSERRRWLLVAFAAATVPMSIVNGSGRSLPVARFVFLVASLALISAWAPKAAPAGILKPPERLHSGT
jgi:hypothetical protein